MIKFVSGWGGPGGSTIAFNSLVNALNAKGIKSCFYTPHKWDGITCEWKHHDEVSPSKEDVFVYHYMRVTDKLPVKKQILSCHETEIFPIKEMNDLVFDDVHFVSNFQRDWHGIDGYVIPNIVQKYTPKDNKFKVAGIIGSVDENKRTHKSIERALKHGHDDVRIYGAVTSPEYFNDKVLPLLGNKVSYRGISTDMQSVYDVLTDVFHSPKLETFNLIKPECKSAGVKYHGDEGNDTQAEYWENDKVLEAWIDLLT